MLVSDRSRAAEMREYWEFPGGKLGRDESAGAALVRELREELGISVDSFEHFHTLEHDYPQFCVVIDFFLVTAWQGKPTGVEGQALRWIDPSTAAPGLLLPADAPVLDALQNR